MKIFSSINFRESLWSELINTDYSESTANDLYKNVTVLQ